jgi:dihydroorotate dehydrogenase
MYQTLFRPILFRLYRGDAEAAHEAVLTMLATISSSRAMTKALEQLFAFSRPELERQLFGLRFPNPLGLAAGMDKDGLALPAWAALGFGFVEVGTVTAQAQPGNPRPRLFRLPADEALINRMGFNNHGAQALATRLKQLRQRPIPIGISIGKAKVTPPEQAVSDYVTALHLLFDDADYIAINVSSPNTPGLRALQDRAQLDSLLTALQHENQLLAASRGLKPRPLLVKIAPDLDDAALLELLAICTSHQVAGLIAVNTTLGRSELRHSDAKLAAETGGLSGRPLAARARAVVRLLAAESGGRMPIIGVGGVSGPTEALQLLEAGASLLQIYTALVYRGPGLPRQIKRTLLP